jgi:hypothetical protein
MTEHGRGEKRGEKVGRGKKEKAQDATRLEQTLVTARTRIASTCLRWFLPTPADYVGMVPNGGPSDASPRPSEGEEMLMLWADHRPSGNISVAKTHKISGAAV